MHTVKGQQARGDKAEAGKGSGQEGGQGGREVNAVMDIAKSASVAQKPNAASALAQNRLNPPVFDDEFFRHQLLDRPQARLGFALELPITLSWGSRVHACGRALTHSHALTRTHTRREASASPPLPANKFLYFLSPGPSLRCVCVYVCLYVCIYV